MPWFAPLLATTLGLPVLPPSPIAGGNVALPCQFPAVVSYRAGQERCSGVLVHPRVMLTAAHCIDQPPTEVRFGETFAANEGRRDVESCATAPEWDEDRSAADDFAYCVLTQPYEGVPVAMALSGCEASQLRAGATAMLVGYGVTPTGDSFGQKRYVVTRTAEDPRADGLISIGDAQANGCIGDSGGPAYLQLEDGSWRVLGISVLSPGCGEGASAYLTGERFIDWVAAQTQLDLRPCRDDDGRWSNECGGVHADPRDTDATWSRGCTVASVPPSGCDDEASAGDSTGSTSASPSSSSSGDDSSDAGGSGSQAPDAPTGSTSSVSKGQDSTSENGCGCRTPTRTPGPWVWMSLGLGLLRRRRATKPPLPEPAPSRFA